MGIDLRQSTASQEVPLGYFVDSTDGDTAETGLTIANTDIKVWKTGATTLADKNSGGATHISGGIYYAVLDATDTDTIGPLVLFVHVSGALAVRVECNVLDEAVYDVKYGTTAPATATNITAATGIDVTKFGGSNITSASGIPEVKVASVANNAITAASIASDAITAAKIATGAIDADALAADASVEINAAVLTVLGTPAGASLAADVAAVKSDTAAILVDTGTTLDGRIPAALVGGKMDSSVGAIQAGTDLSAVMKASVNTEVLDVLNTDTFAEPGQEAPAATNTLVKKIGYLFKFLRNKIEQTSTTLKVYADDGSTVDQKSTVSDDATTYTRGEIGSGP